MHRVLIRDIQNTDHGLLPVAERQRREYYGMDDLKLLEDEIDTAMV